MLPCRHKKINCRQAKSPVIETDRQVSALISEFIIVALFFFSPSLSPLESSTFQVSLARVFPSCLRLSYLFFISSSHVHTSSIVSPHLEAIVVVRYMCSFLILSLRVTPHIHHSILILFTSIRLSCCFVVAHLSSPYSLAGLIIVL